MPAANPRPSESHVCRKCNESFQMVAGLATGADIEYCPTCFEQYMTRGR